MSSPRLRVVYWNNQPTPYVVARLNAVADRGDIEVEAWFDVMRESNRSWTLSTATWRFPWRVLPATGVPIEALQTTRPDILICNYDQRRMVLGAIVGRTLAGRVCLRVLPPYHAQAPITPAKRLVWQLLFRTVDGAKVPGPDGANFAARHGIPLQRSWRVTQSIDVEHYAAARSAHGRPADGGPRQFIAVSRLVESKGIHVLLEAWRIARRQLPEARLLIAGDGPDEGRLQQLAGDLPDVVWLGFVEPDQLPGAYADAHVLVFPTLGDPNGLVVEEAMSAGLAVIATDAAGDIGSRVPPDAGWVVEAGNAAELAAAIVSAGQLPGEDLERMRAANAERARAFAPAAYAEDFSRFCREVMSLPPRHGPAPFIARVVSYARRAAMLRRTTSASAARAVT